jgi:hypothetical protein
MRLHHVLVPAVLAVSAFAEVKIEQPSPYMSSPPPAAADTTVVDPGRKPKCEVQPGLTEAYYADWNLTTDRPSAGPLDVRGPRKGIPTFRAAFDDNGWPTEVAYFDAKMRPRWTKLFKYPAQIPAGPGDVPYTANWIGANGRAIQMGKIAEQFKAAQWSIGMKKYEVGDLLGEPLLIETNGAGSSFSGKPETWVYVVDGTEVRFGFDKDNRLVQLPKSGAAETTVPATVVDSTKAKPAAPKAPADTAKAKSAVAPAPADSVKAKATLEPAADTAKASPKAGKKAK